MFKKIVAVLIAVCTVITCFSSCTAKDKTNKAFYFAVSEMPRYLDPQIAESDGEKIIAVNTFDGLFKLSENGELQNCAVENYSVSNDGLTYTLNLRKDLKYYISSSAREFINEKGASISEKITADDFVFGISRGVLSETNAPDFDLLKPIKNAEAVNNGTADLNELGVKAVNDYTLEITLEYPFSDFLYALSQPVSYPCDEAFFNLTCGRYGLETKYTLSNGAFYVSSITDEKSVKISKNEEYVGEFAAVPASVTFSVNDNLTDVAEKITKGTYDCGFFSTAEAKAKLGNKVQKNEAENINCSLIFNTNGKYLQNVNLRIGLSSCIEKSTVAESNYDYVIPPYYKLLNKSLDNSGVEINTYNIDVARKYMVNSFEELKIDTLTVEILCTKEYEKTAKAVVSCWQKNIGVELNGTVKAVDETEFQKLIKNGEFDTAIYPLMTDDGSAVSFISMFSSDTELNVFGYASEEFDKLTETLEKTPDSKTISLCQSHLLKNAVLLPLYTQETVFAVAKDTENVYFCVDSTNVYFYKGLK